MSAAPVTRAAAAAVAAIVIQFVMVTAYAWPAARLAPRHLPVAVAGPAGPAAAAARAISRAHPGAFDIIRAASPAGARREITSRRAYGAIIAAWAGTGLALVTFSAVRRPGSAGREDTASIRAPTRSPKPPAENSPEARSRPWNPTTSHLNRSSPSIKA
jgi:hypothetical protein